jgi:hypothetical protein
MVQDKLLATTYLLMKQKGDKNINKEIKKLHIQFIKIL